MKKKILEIIGVNLLAIIEKLFTDLYETHAVPFLARQGYVVVRVGEYDRYLRASRRLNQCMITAPLAGNHHQRRQALQELRELVTEAGTIKIENQLSAGQNNGN